MATCLSPDHPLYSITESSVSNMSSYPESELLEPPPSYGSCMGDGSDTARAPAEELPPEKERLREDEDLIEDDNNFASASHLPPPFSVTPGVLVIAPQSVLIHPPVAGARPLYQLSRPLNGHATATCLIDVPATRPIRDDGCLKTVRNHDQLYRLYHEHLPLNRRQAAREVVVNAQHRDQFSGVRLCKDITVGIKGVKISYAAVCADDEEKHPRRSLYLATQKKGGVLEWHDGGGTLVAVETPAVNRQVDEERLEIVVSLDKRYLDLVVALWVARIYQDTQEDGVKEDKQDAKKRRAEQKQLDKEEGRPSGVLHDMKEALGIGYGLKPGNSNRMPGLFGGPPGLKDNGRINWGGK